MGTCLLLLALIGKRTVHLIQVLCLPEHYFFLVDIVLPPYDIIDKRKDKNAQDKHSRCEDDHSNIYIVVNRLFVDSKYKNDNGYYRKQRIERKGDPSLDIQIG